VKLNNQTRFSKGLRSFIDMLLVYCSTRQRVAYSLALHNQVNDGQSFQLNHCFGISKLTCQRTTQTHKNENPLCCIATRRSSKQRTGSQVDRFKPQLGDLTVTLQNSLHQKTSGPLLASPSCPQDLAELIPAISKSQTRLSSRLC